MIIDNDNRARHKPSRFWALASFAAALVAAMMLYNLLRMVEFYTLAGSWAQVRPSPPFKYEIVLWLPWFALSPAIACVASRVRLGDGRLVRFVSIHAAVGLIVAFGVFGAHSIQQSVMGDPLPVFTFSKSAPLEDMSGEGPGLQLSTIPLEVMERMENFEPPTPPRLLFASLASHAVIYFGVMGVLQAFLMYGNLRDREVANADLKAELADTRLTVAHNQLQPHFLFNTLNSISVLIGQDNEAAKSAVIRLSQLLRAVIAGMDSTEIPLAEELELLDAYIEIQRARFGGSISVEVAIAETLGDVLVPTLCLQPLVENSLQHGRSASDDVPLSIVVDGAMEGDSLVLTVRDDGRGGPAQGEIRESVGLRTTRRRIELIYGDSGRLHVEGNPGGFTARLTMPVRRREGNTT